MHTLLDLELESLYFVFSLILLLAAGDVAAAGCCCDSLLLVTLLCVFESMNAVAVRRSVGAEDPVNIKEQHQPRDYHDNENDWSAVNIQNTKRLADSFEQSVENAADDVVCTRRLVFRSLRRNRLCLLLQGLGNTKQPTLRSNHFASSQQPAYLLVAEPPGQ